MYFGLEGLFFKFVSQIFQIPSALFITILIKQLKFLSIRSNYADANETPSSFSPSTKIATSLLWGMCNCYYLSGPRDGRVRLCSRKTIQVFRKYLLNCCFQ